MGRFADVLEKSASMTDAELASQISSLTTLKDSEINAMFPEKPDKQNLLQLLAIVNAATDENNKTAQLINNINTFAGTVIRLVKVLS